jgi:hypothetical protein
MVVAKYPRMRALFVCRLLLLLGTFFFVREDKRKLELDFLQTRESALIGFCVFVFVSNIPSSLWFLVGMLIIIIVVLWMSASYVLLNSGSISLYSMKPTFPLLMSVFWSLCFR